MHSAFITIAHCLIVTTLALRLPLRLNVDKINDKGTVSDLSGSCNGDAQIPSLLHVTAWFSPESEDAKNIIENNRPNLEHRPKSFIQYGTAIQQFYAANAPYLPKDMEIRYYDDLAMENAVACVGEELRQKGFVNGTYEAFKSLRPGAFKADLFRYLVLWKFGGFYLDADVQLHDQLYKFADVEKDCLVTVDDVFLSRKHFSEGYWQAMVAASPRSQAMLDTIKSVVQNLQARKSDGAFCLGVTGPIAFYNAIKQFGHQDKVTVNFKWIHDLGEPEGVFHKTSGAKFASNVRSISQKARVHSDFDTMCRDRKIYHEVGSPESAVDFKQETLKCADTFVSK